MIKLSTAILKGSKGREQTVEELYDGHAVCALGAACFGAGIKPKKGAAFSMKLLRVFPYLGLLNPNHVVPTLADKIVQHNDDDNWSFKQIATWLRKLGY
jgi:hypothetical protein